ncbi:DUF2085 domain-containing protein [Candidatus Fermentibacteria bacterium]|nr:DUF2085 domain-containing protein [Candidatus Fermentibacteria bacterium]
MTGRGLPEGRRRLASLIVGIPALFLFAASLLRGLMPPGEIPVLDPVLSGLCHRIPSRCINLPWGHSAMCARCTSFWMGLFGGSLYHFLRPPRWGVAAGILLLLPVVVDGLAQLLIGCYRSTEAVRMITGAVGGFGVSLLLVADRAGGRSGR